MNNEYGRLKRSPTRKLGEKTMKSQKKPLIILLTAALGIAAQAANAESVLRRGNGSEPHTIDPQTAQGVPESNILRDLFEGLIGEDASGNLVPGVAEKWEISADGKTYTFHLRDAKWSDGSPLTAHDFVYGWQRAVDPATGSHYSFLLYPVKNAQKIAEGHEKDVNQLGVKATDDHTLVAELEGPTPYFLGLVTHATAYPAPKAAVEKHGKKWTRPENIVSNGPFKLDSWQPNAQLVAVKSDQYWDKDAVKLDKVIYYPTENQTSDMNRYRAGEVDMTYEIPNDQIKMLRENFKDELKISSYLGTYYYGFNVTRPPFKDNPKLREALTLAIDRDVITDKVTGAGEKPAYSFVPPGINGYDHYTPDKAARIEKAKKLYEEAGYGKDKPLKVDLLYNTSENHKKIAVAVAAMWKQNLGVQTNLTNQEWKVFLNTRTEKKQTEAFRAGWIGDYNDAYSFLELFQSKSGLNDSGYVNEKFDALLAQAGQEQDMGKRAAILKDAEKMLTDDYPVAPVYSYVTKRLVKPYVKGYAEENVMDHRSSKYMWIEK